ncbi:hypothetical protein CFI14_09495 [Lactiplantibacillus pentosus]|nr:hypothetical protein CFK27_12340 [Lactiplantibacillus pentosus]AYG41323.1 hypothetical protein CFI14_09495 [Lactiplantibacillus pentosus]
MGWEGWRDAIAATDWHIRTSDYQALLAVVAKLVTSTYGAGGSDIKIRMCVQHAIMYTRKYEEDYR